MEKDTKLTSEEVHDTDKQFAEDIYKYLKATGGIDDLTANNVYDVLSGGQKYDNFIYSKVLGNLLKIIDDEALKFKIANTFIEHIEPKLGFDEQHYTYLKKLIDKNYDEKSAEDVCQYSEMLFSLFVISLNKKWKIRNLKDDFWKEEVIMNEIFKQ